MKAAAHPTRYYYLIMLAVLATGILYSAGAGIDSAVTIQPGKDPSQSARDACDPALRPHSSLNTYTINRYLCCEAACRSFCAKEFRCRTSCEQGCTP